MQGAQDLSGHWQLDPELVFLNHGSFGACPRVVLEHQRTLRDELERSPVEFLGRRIQERLDTVREDLGPFVGAAPEDLVFVPNATTGVNSILRSTGFEPGDEILITDHGYNACNNAASFVAERSGARVVVAELPFPLSSPGEALEAILAATTERTRVAVIDHVTSATGLVLPIEAIVRGLRERGVETIVDGAHAVGMLPLDLDALGAAAYTSNAHKWLCAPKGAAFLHVRRDLQGSARPAVISHGANTPTDARSRYLLEFDWCGTTDPTAILTIPAARAFLARLFPGGFDELRAHNRGLVLAGRELLNETLGAAPLAPDEMIGSLAAVPLPESGWTPPSSAFDVDALQTRLMDEHRIEVPISPRSTSPRRLLRVSAQAYNRSEQYRLLAEALTESLELG